MLFISKSEHLRFTLEPGIDNFAFNGETQRKERLVVRQPVVIEFQRRWISTNRQLLDALNFFFPLKNGMQRSPLDNETVLPS